MPLPKVASLSARTKAFHTHAHIQTSAHKTDKGLPDTDHKGRRSHRSYFIRARDLLRLHASFPFSRNRLHISHCHSEKNKSIAFSYAHARLLPLTIKSYMYSQNMNMCSPAISMFHTRPRPSKSKSHLQSTHSAL